MSETKSVRETNNPHGEEYETMPAHAHWDGYDMSLEGCRYNILDGLVAVVPFEADAANVIVAEIEALAQSKGYGDEDSYLCDTGSMTEDEIEASDYHSALMDQHEDDPDSQYTEDTRISINLLGRIAASSDALEMIANLSKTVSAARERGAGMRRAMDVPKDLVPAPRGP